MPIRNIAAKTAIMLFAASFATSTFAQDSTWPAGPITIVVPSNPGTGVDLGARLIADALSKDFDHPVVIENLAGAANTIGAARVANADPDGHTFLHSSLSSIVIAPLVRNDLTYSVDDFAPVGQTMAATNTLVVNPKKLPVETFDEFLDELKNNPGKYNYGSSGVNGLSHLMHELFMLRTGVDVVQIPYSGAAASTTALVAGEVDFAMVSTTPVLQFIDSGELRPLAVAQAERIPQLPDIPSIRELVPNYEGVNNWNGIFAPAGTSKEIVDKMNASVTAFLQSPEGRAGMERIGAAAAPSTPEDFTAQIKREIEMWREVIEAAGLAPQ